MNVRLISVQVGVVVALLLVLWTSAPGDLPVGSGSRERLLTIPDDRLLEVEITGPGENGKRVTIKLTRPDATSDGWVLASHHDHPARTGIITRFVKALREIRAGELQTEDLSELAKFELDDASCRTIGLYGENRQELAKLVIGKVQSGGSAAVSPMGRPNDTSVGSAITFILHQGKVRRTPIDLRDLTLDRPAGEDAFDEPPDIEKDYTQPNYWLDRSIFKIKSKDREHLLAIVLNHEHGQIVLQRFSKSVIDQFERGGTRAPPDTPGDGSAEKDVRVWRQFIPNEDGRTAKDLRKVNESTVQSLIYALNLSARAIAEPMIVPEGARGLSPENLRKFGFTPPALIVEVFFDDDTDHRLVFGKVKEKSSTGVDVEKVYCMLPGAAEIKELEQKSPFGKSKKLLLKRYPVYEINTYELEALFKKEDDFKPTEETPAAGSGSEAAGSGSEAAGSGSGSEAAGSGSGSEAAGSGSGSEAAGSGSGSEAAGSGSGSEAAGSGSGSEAAGSGTGSEAAGSGSGSEAAGSGTGSEAAGSGSGSDAAGSGSGAAGSGSAAAGSGSGSSVRAPGAGDGSGPPSGPTLRARVILIGYQGARDSRATRTKTAAQLLAVTLYEQLTRSDDPASFADLARQHSDDASAATGGDLGQLTRDSRGRTFGDVLFALEKGGISATIELPEGFAIIQRAE